MNKKLTLNNKREYDVFVTALNDVKENFNNSINISIERYKGYKDFCDENVDMISKQELLNKVNVARKRCEERNMEKAWNELIDDLLDLAN